MKLNNIYKIGIATSVVILFALSAYYCWNSSEDYVSNIFPPQVDNDLSFFSQSVCQRVKNTELFQGWKKINEQALQLNERYSSELLKKAAFVIEQLKKNQQIYTQSQGEGQQFQYYQKNLKECVNRTKFLKFELEEVKNKTNQIILEENSEIQKISENIEDHQNGLKDLNNQHQEKKRNLNLVIETLKSLIDQKERLRRSYKNEQELKDYQKELEHDINKINNSIASQELNISVFKSRIEEQETNVSKITKRFEIVNNQLQDLKALEQYFRQDDLYIKEDVPIVQVIYEYSNTLKDREENLKILAKKEKDPIQRQKNLEALNEIQKAQQISSKMYNSLLEIKLECKQDDCTIGTTLEDLKLSDLKEEIQKKQTIYNIIYSEKQSMEFNLQQLMQQLDNENSAYMINKQKLNKLIENQNLLNKTKNQSEELQKLTSKIEQYELKKNQLQEEVDKLQNTASDQQHLIDAEADKVNEKKKKVETLQIERNISINDKNSELYKQVKECIKQKKIYDNFVQKQSNLIEKANEIKVVVQTEVRQIESMLNEYKVTYQDLNLQSNYDSERRQDL
ncbi:unnamed protein product (macronuclear) [Paramecium tetraurelia]|uniref:Uncharacterized protein n=1 Tax=Paramecium tetraurelia TaxID=5888 RepID=A0BC52_PARTE|nr:uncharacterized protein GSPATT00000555001 [Paramecium tetraurelia]CAK56119.1 unnamed protein product [Paramecium tetraurelia]|eukprot:XP_001423517.1 hypothetical protein (macronuclear) [Paramecium tetraurelia strain d4-2]